MQAFIVLLAVASASAFWAPSYTPYTGYAASPYMYSPYMGMPLIKPAEIKPVQYFKPEDYTQTMEYKTGYPMINPYFYPQKMVEMPKVEMDYAGKGEYEAVAAGGVVHKAKRDADHHTKVIPTMYNTFAGAYPTYPTWSPYMASPYMASPYMHAAAPWAVSPYMTAYHGMPIVPKFAPKVVADDRLKADITPDYASKGEYFADNGAVQHIAKRSADPALVYRTNGFVAPSVIPTRSIYNQAYKTPFVGSAYNQAYKTPFVGSTYNQYNQYKTPFVGSPLIGSAYSTYGAPVVGSTYQNTLNTNVFGQRLNSGLYY